ncbi:MAG: RloB domain-containing protein [Lachnospiraceae bacterium]|nr:RloB domain-containing protein [Lachnospiraceae bacterium]
MRVFANKRRNKSKGKPKPLMLLVAEGENVTEQKYFNRFKTPDCPYSIIVHKAGNTTDPVGLKASVERRWREEEGSPEDGDRCCVITDLDCDKDKATLIQKLQGESEVVRFVVSNPCFEIWFLLHFQYTTHEFTDGKEVIRELRKHIAGYKKDMDVYPIIKEFMSGAIINSKKLIAHFEADKYVWPDVRCNPRTDVWELVACLIKDDKDFEKA